MPERIVTVVPEAGLHARPASVFVQAANEYDCDLGVGAATDNGDGDLVDARSMLAVTSLGVGHGEQVRLAAEGDNADEALDTLERVLSMPEEDGEAATS
jgi:phosphocarrier protein HPr